MKSPKKFGDRARSLFTFVSLAALAAVAASACATITSPTGRTEHIFEPLAGDAQMDQMGGQAFTQMEQQTPVTKDPKTTAYVQCIVGPITQAAAAKDPDHMGGIKWDVQVFDTKDVNAFALPGGHIGVYKGILPVAKTDAQLAAVLGHEVGHVMARHSAERLTQSLGPQLGLEAVNLFLSGRASPQATQAIMSGLGLGAQVGILLPFSRTQESEADLIGLDLMARAGFDPHQAIELWNNMSAMAGGSQPPAILSDHPANADRIANLQAHLPAAVEVYNQARASGKTPSCHL